MARACLLVAVLLLSSGVCRGHLEGVRLRPAPKLGLPGLPKEKPCTDTREVVRSMEFDSLSFKDRLPESIGKTSFLEFDFALPVLVVGWTTRGRAGFRHGFYKQEPGFVSTYVVTYITETGKMQQLEDPLTRDGEFKPHGDLSFADIPSVVNLLKPVEIRSIRFTPLTWSGVPFLEVRLVICSLSMAKMILRDALDVSNIEQKVIEEETKKVNKDLLVLQSDLTGQNVGAEDPEVIVMDAKKLKKDIKNLKSDIKEKVIEDALIESSEFPEDYLLLPRKKTKKVEVEIIAEHTPRLKGLNSELAIEAAKAIEQEDDDEEEVVLLETKHSQHQSCRQPEEWRYSAETTPVDTFSALGNPAQAWRAVYDIGYVPYLFPTDTPNHHSHRLLEITFHHRSVVMGLKVAGVSNVRGPEGESEWGAVTRFSLLYKNNGGEWDYYADMSGTPRVFQTGAQSKEDAKNPVVFHLPKALEADAIGIFPDEWVHKPYLSIDILACYLLPDVSKQMDMMEVEIQPHSVEDEGKHEEKIAVDVHFSPHTSASANRSACFSPTLAVRRILRT
ncbi:uncharacterized protein LOC112553678 isoform X2 [Pomacea canaliculata]|uniref:uncharacterized protein LOC112553678 isoform X2 n=1 Tax=Pomacea canaliculata TaxID=400727 RepID=UPI000D7267D3|nr:uncharacterized protein LOC112553678 isoform X2 [Pomacea canaliculata]